jgi:hypothetical protein
MALQTSHLLRNTDKVKDKMVLNGAQFFRASRATLKTALRRQQDEDESLSAPFIIHHITTLREVS